MGWWEDTKKGKNSGAVIGSMLGGSVGAAVGARIDGSAKGSGGAIGQIFGDRDDAGILGTGQFKSKEHTIKDEAFDSAATDQRSADFGAALGRLQGRQAPTMNTSQADQFRAQQQQLAQTLQDRVAGRGQSVAEMQMQRGLNQSLANANTVAAGSRGVSAAMAARLAQNQQATQSQDANAQMGMLRAQEQAQAEGQLGNLTSNARNQDLQTAQSNQTAVLQNQQLQDAQERFYREGQMTMDERQRQAAIERERMKSQQALGTSQINAGAYQNAASNRAGMLGGIGTAIAGIAASDERLKTDIKPLSFNSPADSSFKPTSREFAEAKDDDEEDEKFEPTIAEADKKKKESVMKYLSSPGSTSGGTNHQKAGEGIGKALGATALAMSDERSKTKKSGGEDKLSGFLDSLKGYSFNYKDPAKHGAGEHVGVMAQDLEKTPIGRTMVMDTPEGKMVNFGKAGGTMLASQAMLNERLKKLESFMKKRSA